ncbi:hypothetical protein [Sphingomonas profundi]|uniref:hypothetical protein n=1 Tax=Alterirhizorhabdus profundi TaxID=2681549 RepID=UPI0012E9852C|nr:hypothetical protein [Sphingomonas profundi]
MTSRLVLACLLAIAAAPAAAATPAIGEDEMPTPDPSPAAADPSPWPRGDAAAAGMEEMVQDQQRAIRDALPDARRGDDPAGPPANERLLRTLRKVGGDSVVLRVFRLPLDR